jgi:hypothetical protein
MAFCALSYLVSLVFVINAFLIGLYKDTLQLPFRFSWILRLAKMAFFSSYCSCSSNYTILSPFRYLFYKGSLSWYLLKKLFVVVYVISVDYHFSICIFMFHIAMFCELFFFVLFPFCVFFSFLFTIFIVYYIFSISTVTCRLFLDEYFIPISFDV